MSSPIRMNMEYQLWQTYPLLLSTEVSPGWTTSLLTTIPPNNANKPLLQAAFHNETPSFSLTSRWTQRLRANIRERATSSTRIMTEIRALHYLSMYGFTQLLHLFYTENVICVSNSGDSFIARCVLRVNKLCSANFWDPRHVWWQASSTIYQWEMK